MKIYLEMLGINGKREMIQYLFLVLVMLNYLIWYFVIVKMDGLDLCVSVGIFFLIVEERKQVVD